MKKIISVSQTRLSDQYTISHHSISSLDLMEKAAKAFIRLFIRLFPDRHKRIVIYAGTGNNGGDGLAVARLLHEKGYPYLHVVIIPFSHSVSPNFKTNREKVASLPISLTEANFEDQQYIPEADIVIDALLGSGLNNVISGKFADFIHLINKKNAKVIAIDIPCGMFADQPMKEDQPVLKADLVITFQRPKLNLLLPESAPYLKDFQVVDIGLDEHFIETLPCQYVLIEQSDIRNILKPRCKFGHKGAYGHVLTLAGSKETFGAGILCTLASVYGGAGLTSACIEPEIFSTMNLAVPEATTVSRQALLRNEMDFNQYNALAIGPGLGKGADAKQILYNILHGAHSACIYDADAINLISEDPGLLNLLPENTVITPHMKEFDRLFGKHATWLERLHTAREKAMAHKLVIVLKSRYTMISTPFGQVYFNSTGNPCIATGGSGDVLTGLIAALLAQGYSSVHAALCGVYIHGLSADELARNSFFVSPASKLAALLPQIMGKLILEPFIDSSVF